MWWRDTTLAAEMVPSHWVPLNMLEFWLQEISREVDVRSDTVRCWLVLEHEHRLSRELVSVRCTKVDQHESKEMCMMLFLGLWSYAEKRHFHKDQTCLSCELGSD